MFKQRLYTDGTSKSKTLITTEANIKLMRTESIAPRSMEKYPNTTTGHDMAPMHWVAIAATPVTKSYRRTRKTR